jgi:transcriptional antiterminator RfaH
VDSGEPIEGLCWYAIHTKPKNEDRANSNLIAWGVEAFAPRVREYRYNEFTHKPTALSKPLFPRYIFARFNARALLHDVCYTKGVHGIVSFNNCPFPLGPDEITLIKSRLDENGFIKMNDELNPGDEITIKGGAFAGLNGIFDREISGKDRVMIFLEAIKYQASVTIERTLIQKAHQN